MMKGNNCSDSPAWSITAGLYEVSRRYISDARSVWIPDAAKRRSHSCPLIPVCVNYTCLSPRLHTKTSYCLELCHSIDNNQA